jgi:hypothetical protein
MEEKPAAPAPKAEEPAKADVEETVRAIESTAARLQADDDLKLDMPDDTASYRPKQRKLDNTQPFTF